MDIEKAVKTVGKQLNIKIVRTKQKPLKMKLF